MKSSGQTIVIGVSMLFLCSSVAGRNIRKRRQSDFIFPDDDIFDGFGNNVAGAGNNFDDFDNRFQQFPPRPFPQPQFPPQPRPELSASQFQRPQFQQPSAALEPINQQAPRLPLLPFITPGPPANIDSPTQGTTVMPDTVVTTESPGFLNCMTNCPTTSEYNPICGTNRQLYFNRQKFDCAKRCGAQVKVWRHGSCAGLFTMMRG